MWWMYFDLPAAEIVTEARVAFFEHLSGAFGWVYLLAVWILHFRYKASNFARNFAVPIGIVVIIGSSATPEPVLSTGLVMLALVALSTAISPSVAAKSTD